MLLFSALAVALTACEGSDWDRHALTGPESNRLIASVEIQPSGSVIDPDGVEQFSALVKSARGAVVSRNVTWRSLDEDVLKVDASGTVIGMNEGTARLEATHQGVTGQTTVDVHGEVVAIRLSENSLSIDEGEAAQIEATYVYANGAERPAGPLEWRSDDPSILQVDSDGLAQGIRSGVTRVRVRGRGHELFVDGRVRAGTVASVVVVAPSTSLAVGEEFQFWAEIRDAESNRLLRPVQWSSSNTGVATVDGAGLVKAREAGDATIRASADGITGSVDIQVGSSGAQTEARPAPVRNLTVISTETHSVTLRFTEVDDGMGQPAKYDIRYAKAPLGWGWGQATSVMKGTCKVPVQGSEIGSSRTCTVEGLQPSAKYDFQLVPFHGTLNAGATFGPLSNIAGGTTKDAPIKVDVLPSGASIDVGAELQVRATVTDLYGNPQNKTVSWSSSRSSVAAVSGSGNTATVKAVAAGDTEVRATTEGIHGISKIRVIQPAPSGAIRPNEPSGFRRIAEHDFSCLPGNGCALTGNWSRRTSDAHNLSIVNDHGAPQSPASVIRGRFPSGLPAGQSPFRFDGWGPRQWQAEYDEVYLSFWMKIEGSTYQNEATGTKMWYISYGSSQRNNQSTMFLRGNGTSGALMDRIHLHYFISEMRSDGSDPGGGAVAHAQNISSNPFRVGRWHQIEFWMKINDIGQANGEVKWWLDGTLVAHHRGKRFRSSANPKAFYHMQFTPVWGGGIGRRTRDDYWLIDHFYISAR